MKIWLSTRLTGLMKSYLTCSAVCWTTHVFYGFFTVWEDWRSPWTISLSRWRLSSGWGTGLSGTPVPCLKAWLKGWKIWAGNWRLTRSYKGLKNQVLILQKMRLVTGRSRPSGHSGPLTVSLTILPGWPMLTGYITLHPVKVISNCGAALLNPRASSVTL